MNKIYQIALTMIPNVGDKTGKRLVAYCGGVEAVFKEKKSMLSKIPGIGSYILRSFNSTEILANAEKELNFINKYKIKCLFYLDDFYPSRLKHCVDSPVMLYYKGNSDLNVEKIISVVGSRRASEYGKSICYDIVSGLATQKVLIISGLAYGIDACSHKTALECNIPTVGVVGHGLDRIYPQLNKKLAESMLENGGILTEFISGTKPDKENFPKRNRIVAGLSDAVIIIEADRKSGALITADIANSYNRDVFAVPGRVGDEKSTGCNHLIKTNKAALVQSAEDIIYFMGWENEQNTNPNYQTTLFAELSEDEKKLVAILDENKVTGIDDLCILSGISMNKTASLLLNLEFKGIVKCMPGKRFARL